MTKKHLPLDELSGAIGRILGLLLTEEKVDQAVQSLSQAIKESVPGSIGACCFHPGFPGPQDQYRFYGQHCGASGPPAI